MLNILLLIWKFKTMTPRSMHVLMSAVNEDIKCERWTSGSLLWVLFSPATIELHFGHSLWETKRQSSSSHNIEKNKEAKKQNNPLETINTRAMCSTEGKREEGDRKPGGHTGHVRKITAIPVTWWADGWSHDYMHTKSYKSQVQHSFFKWHALGLCVVPLWPAGLWLI